MESGGERPAMREVRQSEKAMFERERVTRAWKQELGKRVLESSDVASVKENIAKTRAEIAEGKLPEGFEKAREEERAQNAKKPEAEQGKAFNSKKNAEALGAWALGWNKKGDKSDQEFSEELVDQRAATRMFNYVGELRPDAIRPVEGAAPGQAAARGLVAGAEPMLQLIFRKLNTMDLVSSRDVQEWESKLTDFMVANGKIGDPIYNAFTDGLTDWINDVRVAEGGAQYRIVTSEIAEAEFNAVANNYPAKEAWVRDKISKIRAASKASGGFAGANFVPYQELTGAENAIKQFSVDLWLEEQHTLTVMDLGISAKSAHDMEQMLEPANRVSAETLEVMFRLKTKRARDGVEINAVAEAFRILEKHRGEYNATRPDNKYSFMKRISWELEGYSWADAEPRARLLKDPSRNMWAAQDAEDLFLSTLRGTVPAVNPVDGKTCIDSALYPAYRLKTLNENDKVVLSSFKNVKPGSGRVGGELNKYMSPYLMDFWQYIAESKTVDGVGTLKKPNPADPEYTSLVGAGLLVPAGGGIFNTPASLENVRFEQIEFVKEMVKGIFPKYWAYANTTDSVRTMTEKGGVFTHPDMETFAKTIEAGLWKNFEHMSRRDWAICNVTEGIIEFNRRRSFIFPHSYSERDLKTWYEPIGKKWQYVAEIGKLLAPPFNISIDSPAFLSLLTKYNLGRRDFQPKIAGII